MRLLFEYFTKKIKLIIGLILFGFAYSVYSLSYSYFLNKHWDQVGSMEYSIYDSPFFLRGLDDIDVFVPSDLEKYLNDDEKTEFGSDFLFKHLISDHTIESPSFVEYSRRVGVDIPSNELNYLKDKSPKQYWTKVRDINSKLFHMHSYQQDAFVAAFAYNIGISEFPNHDKNTFPDHWSSRWEIDKFIAGKIQSSSE